MLPVSANVICCCFACRTTEHILKLEDPNSLEDDMGVIVLNLNLVVKQGDFKRHVSATVVFFLKSSVAVALSLLGYQMADLSVIVLRGKQIIL